MTAGVNHDTWRHNVMYNCVIKVINGYQLPILITLSPSQIAHSPLSAFSTNPIVDSGIRTCDLCLVEWFFSSPDQCNKSDQWLSTANPYYIYEYYIEGTNEGGYTITNPGWCPR